MSSVESSLMASPPAQARLAIEADRRPTTLPRFRVALDVNPLLRQRYSGFWTVGAGLLPALFDHERLETAALLCSRKSLDATSAIRGWDGPKNNVVATRTRIRRWERWWHVSSWPPLQHFCGEFDVYHCFHHLMPPTQEVPRVMTVYDLRRYRLPELYPKSKTDTFERALTAADRYMAISHTTKKDLVALLGVPADKIDVTPLGTPDGFAPLDDDARHEVRTWLAGLLGRPVTGYALTIGSNDRRKNLARTVRAFAQARSSLPADFRLVIVGNTPDDGDLETTVADSGCADSIVMTGSLPEKQLRSVVAAADTFLFISLYEGFGLPILEAMASGVPVITSACSSMPEVAGDAALLVDPLDTDEIAERLVELVHDDNLRGRLAQAGLARCRQYTWSRCAQAVIDCYAKVVEEHPR